MRARTFTIVSLGFAAIAAAAAATAAGAPEVPAVATAKDMVFIDEERLQDPEYLKAWLAALRASLPQAYPGLAEELRLTGDEAARFFDKLAENQLAAGVMGTRNLSALFSVGGQRDPAAEAERLKNSQALQREHADSLRAILGPARYIQWMDYQQTRSERMQVSKYADALAQAGLPLDDSQLKTVTTAFLQEEQSLQRDILALGRSVDVANPRTRMQAQEALNRRKEESGQHVLDAVAPYLSLEQQRRLRALISLQEAANRTLAEEKERVKALQARP